MANTTDDAKRADLQRNDFDVFVAAIVATG